MRCCPSFFSRLLRSRSRSITCTNDANANSGPIQSGLPRKPTLDARPSTVLVTSRIDRGIGTSIRLFPPSIQLPYCVRNCVSTRHRAESETRTSCIPTRTHLSWPSPSCRSLSQDHRPTLLINPNREPRSNHAPSHPRRKSSSPVDRAPEPRQERIASSDLFSFLISCILQY